MRAIFTPRLLRALSQGALSLALVTQGACAPDLREEFPFDGELPPGQRVRHEEQTDGALLTRVDASAKEALVYLDLDTRAELDAGTALETQAWDLAFQRFKIVSNGG